LQRRLLAIINQATAAAFIILEQYGETETTIIDLEQLQNARERAETYYSRFYTLLLQIAESQPLATAVMLNILTRSIEEDQATVGASEATIQETKRDWNIL
jgi:hypothetical protein